VLDDEVVGGAELEKLDEILQSLRGQEIGLIGAIDFDAGFQIFRLVLADVSGGELGHDGLHQGRKLFEVVVVFVVHEEGIVHGCKCVRIQCPITRRWP
jgi:hypothetical protein